MVTAPPRTRLPTDHLGTILDPNPAYRREPAPVPPPAFDPPDLRPRSPLAVVTLAGGWRGEEMLAVSLPGIESLAKRCGADLHVLRAGETAYPLAQKWRVRDYIAAYDRTLWLDADVVVHPDCPDPFQTFPAGRWWVWDDWRHNAPGSHAQFTAEYRELIGSQGFDMTAPEVALNTGVWLLDRGHAGVFAPAARPFTPRHCAEQWHATLLAVRDGVPVGDLPEAWNYQWWPRRDSFGVTEGVWVYHLSGLHDHPRRVAEMARIARDLGYHCPHRTVRRRPLPCVRLSEAAVTHCTTCGVPDADRAYRDRFHCNHPDHPQEEADGLVSRGGTCDTCPHYEEGGRG